MTHSHKIHLSSHSLFLLILFVLSTITLSGCIQNKNKVRSTEDSIKEERKEVLQTHAEKNTHNCLPLRRRIVHSLADYVIEHPNDFTDPNRKTVGKDEHNAHDNYLAEVTVKRDIAIERDTVISHEIGAITDQAGDTDYMARGFGGIGLGTAGRGGRGSSRSLGLGGSAARIDYLSRPSYRDKLQYTDTNSHESGSVEPDLVKTIGNYTYVLNRNELTTYKTWPPKEVSKISTLTAKEITRKVKDAFGSKVDTEKEELQTMLTRDFNYSKEEIELKDRPVENLYFIDLLQDHDHLVLIASVTSNLKPTDPDSYLPEEMTDSVARTTAKQRELFANADKSIDGTRIIIFDRSNPEQLKIEKTIDYEATYKTARTTPQGSFLMLQIHGVELPLANYLYASPQRMHEIDMILNPNFGNEFNLASYEKKKALRQLIYRNLLNYINEIIPDSVIESMIPNLTIYNKEIKKKEIVPLYQCDKLIETQPNQENKNVFVISKIPMGDNKKPQSVGILAKPEVIYANDKSIYISSKHVEYSDYQNRVYTEISKFKINSSGTHFPIEYEGSGELDGTVVKQFQMSEHNDFLRVIVTDYRNNNPSLYILHKNLYAKELVIASRIPYIVRGEEVKSVRFIGNKGFVVTFRRIDPLFALDLADPYQPKLLGRLEIPGFSTYMHPLDDNHILTIGRSGSSSQPNQLQVFDIHDLMKPTRTASHLFDADSIALNEHLAFTFDPTSGILSIPAEKYNPNDDSGWYREIYFGGFYFFKIKQNNIKQLGEINQIKAYCDKLKRQEKSNKCDFSINSNTFRSIIMSEHSDRKNYIYTISNLGLFVQPEANLSNITSIINIPKPEISK